MTVRHEIVPTARPWTRGEWLEKESYFRLEVFTSNPCPTPRARALAIVANGVMSEAPSSLLRRSSHFGYEGWRLWGIR
jgi:hypothetical protein